MIKKKKDLFHLLFFANMVNSKNLYLLWWSLQTLSYMNIYVLLSITDETTDV